MPVSLPQISTVQETQVAQRAYAKWAARCLAGDQQQHDWLEAEAELALSASLAGRLSQTTQRMACLLAERRESERRLVAEHAVSSILAVAATLIDAAPRIVQAICESLEWDVGVVWVLDGDADCLRCVNVWHRGHVEIPAFESDNLHRTFFLGMGLPGRVWALDSVIWVPDVSADANFPRAQIAAAEGLRGAVGFPVRNGVEFLGVLEFFSKEVRKPDEQVTEMMSSIGRQISQFIERRGAERRLLVQEHERCTARQIQQQLLPKSIPQLSGFQISGRSVAPNVVGGDCFDFIPLSEGSRNCIGVLVADASGHGIAAALLTGQTRAYLRGIALTSTDVAHIIELTNHCLSNDLITDHFVTAFLMRLDPDTRTLHYASAGHLPGHFLDSSGRSKAVLPSTGLPLGIDPSLTFPKAPAVSLAEGDLVLVVTDGIIEAATLEGELFGMERALHVVRRHQHKTPDEILAALFDAVNRHCDMNILDDLTAVIIKVDEAVREDVVRTQRVVREISDDFHEREQVRSPFACTITIETKP